MKKLIALALASLLTFSLAGCATTPTGGTSSTGKDSSKPAEPQTLKLAVLETAYGTAAWADIITAFETANPGVKVELTMDKKIEDVISSSMKAGEFPDVIHCGVGREAGLTETFVKDKNIADISDVFTGELADKIIPGFLDTTITNPYSDGKTYLAPMFYSPCGLFYNAGLLKQKGWDLPTTWDEMWALGDKAKAEGIALFTYPTTGYFDAFFYALLNEVGGPDFFAKAMSFGEGIWATPEATKAFDIIEKLASYTEKTTPANANDNDFKKNQQLILDNKAIFMPNGTWITGEMADAPRADGFEWGFTGLPAVAKGGDAYSYTFFEQLWVPAEAKNVDLAKKFIAFMYSDEAATIFAKVGAVQPLKGMVEKLDGEQKMFYSIYENGTKAAMGGFATTDPVEGVTIRGTFFDPVNSLVSGDKTKADWIAALTKDSDALRAALK